MQKRASHWRHQKFPVAGQSVKMVKICFCQKYPANWYLCVPYSFPGCVFMQNWAALANRRGTWPAVMAHYANNFYAHTCKLTKHKYKKGIGKIGVASCLEVHYHMPQRLFPMKTFSVVYLHELPSNWPHPFCLCLSRSCAVSVSFLVVLLFVVAVVICGVVLDQSLFVDQSEFSPLSIPTLFFLGSVHV